MAHCGKLWGIVGGAAFVSAVGCGIVGDPSAKEYTPVSGDEPHPGSGDAHQPSELQEDKATADVPDIPAASMGGAGLEGTPPKLKTDFGPGPRPYRALEVATGTYHSCALLEDGRVKCWGNNGYGQLGLGDEAARGSHPDEMGDALPFVDLGEGQRAKHIYAGRYASCAMLQDDSVKCWGFSFLEESEGHLVGMQEGEMGDALPPLSLSLEHQVVDVVLGIRSQCLVLADESFICIDTSSASTRVHLAAASDSELKNVVASGSGAVFGFYSDDSVRRITWDSTDGPQQETIIAHDTSFLASFNDLCFLRRNGRLECEWNDEYVVRGSELDFTQMGSTQHHHSCGIRMDGSIYCWEGRTDGVEWFVYEQPGQRLILDRAAVQISRLGFSHLCALDIEGYVSCWDTQVVKGPWTGLSDAATTRLQPVDLGTYTAQ